MNIVFSKGLTASIILLSCFSVLTAGFQPFVMHLLTFVVLMFLYYSNIKITRKELLLFAFILTTAALVMLKTLSYMPMLYGILILFFYLSLSIDVHLRSSKQLLSFILIFICIVVIFNFFIFGGLDSRNSASYGDPNFATMWTYSVFYFIVTLYFSLNSENALVKNILVFSFAMFVVVLTQSRMGAVAALFFLISYWFVYKKLEKSLRAIVFMLLIFSLVAQYFSYFLLLDFLEINQYQESSLSDRMANINDESNLERFSSAYFSINFFFSQSPFTILFGDLSLFDEVKKVGSIPHNWFIQSLFISGFIFSLVNVLFIVYLILKISLRILPYVGVMLIMGTILTWQVIPLMYLFVALSIIFERSIKKGNTIEILQTSRA
jgi:hypothetical protein